MNGVDFLNTGSHTRTTITPKYAPLPPADDETLVTRKRTGTQGFKYISLCFASAVKNLNCVFSLSE